MVRNAPVIAVSAGAVGFLLGLVFAGFSASDYTPSSGTRLLRGALVGGIFALVGGGIGIIFNGNNSHTFDNATLNKKRLLLLEALKQNKFK